VSGDNIVPVFQGTFVIGCQEVIVRVETSDMGGYFTEPFIRSIYILVEQFPDVGIGSVTSYQVSQIIPYRLDSLCVLDIFPAFDILV